MLWSPPHASQLWPSVSALGFLPLSNDIASRAHEVIAPGSALCWPPAWNLHSIFCCHLNTIRTSSIGGCAEGDDHQNGRKQGKHQLLDDAVVGHRLSDE